MLVKEGVEGLNKTFKPVRSSQGCFHVLYVSRFVYLLLIAGGFVAGLGGCQEKVYAIIIIFGLVSGVLLFSEASQ